MHIEELGGKSLEEVFREFKATQEGLTSTEAKRRRTEYGPNKLVFHRAKPPILMLLEEFRALFPVLLLIAALLAFLADYLSPGEGYNFIGIALFGVVVLNAVVSFIQNYRVEKLMLSFLDYIPKEVALMRDGKKAFLDAEDIVPGDLLMVQEGDKISADGIIVSSSQLLVDESILTGESEPIEKADHGSGGELGSFVYSGATVMRGDATILVAKTGRRTKIGSISELSQTVQRGLTPMQVELQHFVKRITYLALGIGFVFFILGFLIGNTFWTNLIFAIGIIVANVPEGLLPTVTLALTQASVRMGRENAVIKHILSVETLGSTTVICTDKTGTLTINKLHVEKLYLDFEEINPKDKDTFLAAPASRTFKEIMGLCNNVLASKDNSGSTVFRGDPTEVAMAEFIEKFEGYDALRSNFEHLHTKPFNPEEKYMASAYRTRGGTAYMTVKGAPDVILERSKSVHCEGFVRDMSPKDREALSNTADSYAANGLRVLALAYKIAQTPEEEAVDLVFVGLVAMVDPPRAEVPRAVDACKTAGIKIIVISGDKTETVSYIAKKLKIVENPRVIEGEELSGMSQDRLKEELKKDEIIFARTAPEQKLAIVEALKEMGEVVAVTGDGVNDAPALKKADIGVSMGLRGTDVAKEASDIILLDDNFATIVRAIEEGRSVYDNIKKFITYILTSNVPEILPFIAYVLFPIPLPITVIQILAIDLITDMLPAIGLGNEPPERDIMERPPRRREERLVSFKTFLRSYGIVGPVEALLSFMIFFTVLFGGGWTWGERLAANDPLYRQAAGAFLAGIIFSQIGNVMACRTNRQSAIARLGRFNPLMAAGIVVEAVFIFAIVYVPVFHSFFTTAPIAMDIWPVIALTPFVVFTVEEIRKFFVRKGLGILSG